MRIATHTLSYNVSRFIPDVIDNAGPHVDKIFVAYSRRPWGYNPHARANFTNPTRIEEFRAAKHYDKIEFIEGDWDTDEGMRNACLERAKAQGFDWLIAQDADEFYTDHAWRQIRHFLETVGEDVKYVRTTWYNYWKTAQYILVYDHGAIKDAMASFAIRCHPDIHYTRSREPNVPHRYLLDTPAHHFGWALSDEEMLLKVQTWMHTTEFDPQAWYRMKWLGWNERTRNLNPMNPTLWRQAIRTPFELPDFAQKYAPSLEGHRVPPFGDYAANALYDLRHTLLAKARYLNKSLRGDRQWSR